ncbi:MAG: DNA polymerase III subunit gamma/tau [Bacteroidales bacterium]|nr:DNA polymerase III subunit gamma/tau [Bacteroidales bacterium]
MEKFIVSARKYRPVTFDSVIGQEAITITLKNTIRNDHLAQAYLFCGPRGVGKTTCARIFAKTINCEHVTEDTEPCNQCESCKAFNDLRSFNIHELDAASNNSVEDIRNLIDQIRIPPQIGKYSVYIIDEVHMLSASAFNAFLKTLEEPPKHAVFILATTEKHKIIPTILSRCQIFDFNRIKVQDIVNHLSQIAVKEQIHAEPDGLNIIAQKADGAMRDALSIFDQIVSFSGGEVTYKNVISSLNILDYEYYFRLTDAFLKGDHAGALMTFNEILEHGFDAQNFIVGMGAHFRDILVCKDPKTIQLLEVGEGIRARYLEQSKQCPVPFLLEAIQACSQCDINFRNTRNSRLLVELTLLQLSSLLGEGKKKVKQDQPEIIKPVIQERQKVKSSAGHIPVMQAPVQESGKNVQHSPGELMEQFSIGSLLHQNKQKKEEEVDEQPENKVEEPVPSVRNFSADELEAKFLEFTQKLKAEKPRMFSALNNRKPTLENDTEVHLWMDNEVQIDDFNRDVKSDLLRFLRVELNNADIQIYTEVKVTEVHKRLYTPEDKYQALSSKNPLLDRMRQQFNLDFE